MSDFGKLIEQYVAGAARVRESVAGMTPAQLQARPIAGRWSTHEVICHLADSEQAWAHRLKRVIAEDKPLLIGYAEDRFAATLGYHQRPLEGELDLIERTRRQMAVSLRQLPAEAFARVGIHSEMGKVTLEQMLQIEIDHITHHLHFIQEKRRALGLPAT